MAVTLAAGGLVGQAVEPDLCGLCGGGRRALHPGVVEDVLERRPLGGPQGQAQFDQLLTLCGEERGT